MKYKLAIFDLDGTILETLEDLYNSVNYALSQNNLPVRTLKEVRAFVGNGIRNLMIRSCPDNSPTEVVDMVHKTFVEHYSAHKADNTAPYEGIVDLLKTLKKEGYLLAVASNKDDTAVKPLCVKFFEGLFDLTLGNRPDIARKPAPDCVWKIIKDLGASLDDTVYIGDSEVDIETAKRAEVPCITVTWGFRDEPDLKKAGATIIAHDVNELKNLL